MAAGLFELRKDPITGWWVATVVDRAFHRDRFARAAEPVDDQVDGCANCSIPAGDGVRVRMLKDFAFHVVGTGEDARELDRSIAQVPLSQARATGSWRTIVAPPGEHRPLHAVGNDLIEALVGRARDALADARASGQTDYLQVVQNWGAQAGARTNHLCLDLYDLPQIPHRIAEEMGGAARFVIREGECPFCRIVREASAQPERLVWDDASSVAIAPYASRSPFEVWIVPRRHEADFGRSTATDIAATAEALRQVLSRLADQPRRAALQPRPPQRAVARADRRDLSLALGDPPPAARDRRPRAGHRPAGQPGVPRGRRRGAPGPRGAGGGRLGLTGHAPAGRHTVLAAPRLWADERAPPNDRASWFSPLGAFVVVDLSLADSRDSLGRSTRTGPRGVAVSGVWDRDEAARLRRGAVRQASRRDLRVPAADAARARARRRPHAGRVHQGVPELRDAREARERPCLALPDRPPRGARRDPPPQDHPLLPVDRRIARARRRPPSTW